MSGPSLKNEASLNTRSPQETFNLGTAFGLTAEGGEVIALSGMLGAGKTQFVKGLAQGLGISPEKVTSPTFILMHSYVGRLVLTHIDLYRLENDEEISALGLEEEIEDDLGLAAVEWADKGESLLPPGRLGLQIKLLEGDAREILMQASDPLHVHWMGRSLKKYVETQNASETKALK